MNTNKLYLATQIKKVIGNRILFCSVAFLAIIFSLTIYDLSIDIKQLCARINEQLKPIEDFAINQAIINNLETVNLKIDSFNESNKTFKIQWIRQGKPINNQITWRFPFFWTYDYAIGDIAGYHFGYFKVNGSFLSDATLIYDLMFRLGFLIIFIASILSILFPLAKKIPEQLFLNPINRFIDLVSNNSVVPRNDKNCLPLELELLEARILSLLKTATEHERNKTLAELGLLSARLAHDIRSPLAAMEMSIDLIIKSNPKCDMSILINGIRNVRDIAKNVLDYYHSREAETKSTSYLPYRSEDNLKRPTLLFSIIELILNQKKQEWRNEPCEIRLTLGPKAKITWIDVVPNEIKRLLSNLLNNSYDALFDKTIGLIKVNLEIQDDNLVLEIKDNGKGIPSDKLKDVLDGLSLKTNGTGLGLSSAKNYMNLIEGKIHINSILGKWTSIYLFFPIIKSIPWFKESISLSNKQTVIILDDDFSMLMYWEQRISELGLKIKLFSEYNKALQWLNENRSSIDDFVFIVDYELADKCNNGLMFIDRIEIKTNCYLVTSHGEDFNFQEIAHQAGIGLIPKSVINEINLIM